MLSAAQIASMRATSLASLPDTAAVSRVTRTSDGAGGYTEAWATVATVPCRIASTGGAEAAIAAKLTATTTATVTLPALTDVAPADRLVVGSRTFEVLAVLSARSWEIARRVLAVEIV